MKRRHIWFATAARTDKQSAYIEFYMHDGVQYRDTGEGPANGMGEFSWEGGGQSFTFAETQPSVRGKP